MDNMAGIERLFLIFLGLTTVFCQENDTTVLSIATGDRFIVPCDATSVTIPDLGVSSIKTLTLSKYDGTIFSILAEYTTVRNSSENGNIPLDDGRFIVFSGANDGNNNVYTMKVQLVVPEAQCRDAGLYQCMASYARPTDNAVMTVYSRLEARMKPPTEDLSMTYTSSSSGSRSREDYYEFEDGEYVNLTCRVYGPQNLQLVWMELSASDSDSVFMSRQFVEYPIQENITKQTPVLVPGTSCNQYAHQTELRLLVTEQIDGNTYKCSVRENSMEKLSSNFTVGIKQNAASPAEDEPSLTTILIIVGAILGGILIAAVITILICYYYRRSKRQRKHRYDADKVTGHDNKAHKVMSTTDGGDKIPVDETYDDPPSHWSAASRQSGKGRNAYYKEVSDQENGDPVSYPPYRMQKEPVTSNWPSRQSAAYNHQNYYPPSYNSEGADHQDMDFEHCNPYGPPIYTITGSRRQRRQPGYNQPDPGYSRNHISLEDAYNYNRDLSQADSRSGQMLVATEV